MSAAPAPPVQHLTLLAADRLRMSDRVDAVPVIDRSRRGSVAIRPRAGLVQRAERGPDGPLVYEATQHDDHVDLTVWGAATTSQEAREDALDQARGWIGWHDHQPDLVELTAGHAALQRAARQLGPVRLSRLPTVGEAVGRAVLGQLVQGLEARHSTAQLAALAGAPTTRGLWCWPT
ncbi:MAG: hypothetical protein KY460_12030, partial [Actinobacteria bacterium]|nr:hypothetical protein [Actinomycetota bacterium]